MALANSRKIKVNGLTYEWRISGPKDRYRTGWTPGQLTLLLLLTIPGSRVRRILCNSKHWTTEHSIHWDDGYSGAPEHKIPFGPAQVRQVIEEKSLTDWTYTEQV